MNTKIKSAYYSNEQQNIKNKEIKLEEISKEIYDEMYRGHLTCINECKARIKFTERKDGVKFYSTWNGDGNLHDLGCPYNVNYKGEKGRAKFKAFYKAIKIDDDTILRKLKNRFNKMRKDINNPGDSKSELDSRMKYINNDEGEDRLVVNENGVEQDKIPNIRYSNAEQVTTDDIGAIKAVWGIIDNVQLVENSTNDIYAYFNLRTENNKINIYFPEAFYKNEQVNSIEEFKLFINNVQKMVDEKEIFVIAYGEIKKKKKLGLNVNVISPKRLIINGKTYYNILKESIV